MSTTSFRIRHFSGLVLPWIVCGCATPLPTVPREISVAASSCKQPPYPAAARRDEAAGTTELEFEVNAVGKVTRAAIIKSSGSSAGHRLLDSTALEALTQCAFPAAPGYLPATARLAYVWRLQD